MRGKFLGLGLIISASSVAAHDRTEELLSIPTTADYSAAQAVTAPVIRRIEAEDFDGAIALIAAGSEIFASKKAELNVLKGQAGSLTTIYGPVEKCILSSRDYVSELRIRLSYICQHSELLVQWTFSVDKVPRGWIVSNFRFQDQF